ncbi:hypothetical protein EIP86_005561 [Pleurotus ostreatoroseus]|nr:hypothetical protein EIP86_005561 [Pleurotus ostreatoroseus]
MSQTVLEAHTECSESFYRKELENDIHSAPSKSTEERRQMLELLKRFEEENDTEMGELAEGDSDDSDEEDSLVHRLEHVDLHEASYDEIWTSLTPAERDKFLKTLNDPSGTLAQQLLASEELEEQVVEPWWDRPSGYAEQMQTEGLGTTQKTRRCGDVPQFVDIPPSARRAAEGVGTSGPSLLYNICAVILAYAFITRHLSTSPLSSSRTEDTERTMARKLFVQLAPFLTDRKSTTVLPSLSSVITHLWSRFPPDTMTSAFFALIMRDAATLLRPAPVVTLPEPTPTGSPTFESASHPSSQALHVISDIASLFQAPPPPPPPPPPSVDAPPPPSTHPSTRGARPVSPASAKALFYAARVCSTPAYILGALADELTVRAGLVGREGEGGIGRTADTTGPPTAQVLGRPMTTPPGNTSESHPRGSGSGALSETNRARIEELT